MSDDLERLADLLTTVRLGRAHEHHASLSSTNDRALAWLGAGAPDGALVTADQQTAGRGRLGRAWSSPAGRDVYASVILRPGVPALGFGALALAVGVGLREGVLAAFGGEEVWRERGWPELALKWPNDVLLGGLKTSGILMEMGAEATRVRFLVLGIGVNLNVSREAFPDQFRAVATSVASHLGRPVDRIGFAARLYDTLEAVLDLHADGGFEAVRPRFEARFRMRGRRIRVLDAVAGAGAPALEGRAAGIDADGALWVERDDGSRERVVAGDVTIAK